MNSKYTKHMDQEHIVKIVSDLIAINTVNPPGNEHLVLPIVKPLMEDLGMEVMTYEKESGRTNIVGKLGSGGKSVAFISHMDTVPPGDRELWDTDPFTPVVKDGKIFGRGALDDKGSFAACYSACKAFIAENPNFGGTIYLVAAADEELGSRLGVIYLMQDENFR
ncbi:MAG TPA: M20 family metallopeptidase, partial [Patescibacteria group bacterium]|nr:M20 family metallopeptidase [Patescibacteria group bacterium]